MSLYEEPTNCGVPDDDRIAELEAQLADFQQVQDELRGAEKAVLDLVRDRDEARHGRQIHVEASEVLTRRLQESRQQADALGEQNDNLLGALDAYEFQVVALEDKNAALAEYADNLRNAIVKLEAHCGNGFHRSIIEDSLALPVPPTAPHPDTERLDKLRAHNLDQEWKREMPASISQETLAAYTQLGAYYIGWRAAWEEVHHLIYRAKEGEC